MTGSCGRNRWHKRCLYLCVGAGISYQFISEGKLLGGSLYLLILPPITANAGTNQTITLPTVNRNTQWQWFHRCHNQLCVDRCFRTQYTNNHNTIHCFDNRDRIDSGNLCVQTFSKWRSKHGAGYNTGKSGTSASGKCRSQTNHYLTDFNRNAQWQCFTGTITSYAWTLVSGPNTPTITTPTAVSTTVTGLIQGTYIFQLALNGGVSTANDTVIVNPAPPPVANAGPKQTITLPTSTVTLNGSASTGTITSYAWSFVSGPNTPTITTPTAAKTTVQV